MADSSGSSADACISDFISEHPCNSHHSVNSQAFHIVLKMKLPMFLPFQGSICPLKLYLTLNEIRLANLILYV